MKHSLKEIKDILDKAMTNLSWTVTTNQANTAYITLHNAEGLKLAVEDIKELGLFPNEVNQLSTSALYSANGANIKIATQLGGQVNVFAQALKDQVVGLQAVLEMIIEEESPNSINVKLPPVNDFKDLAVYSNTLHTALTQVLFLPGVNGNLHIESVENGSIWLNVLLEGEHALKAIGELVFSAAIIYKEIMRGRKISEEIKALKHVKKDTIEDIDNVQKESLKGVTQSEADSIGSRLLTDADPDSISRIKESLKLLAELLSEGAEIRPALNASNETKTQFPDMKALPTLESRTKLLEPPVDPIEPQDDSADS